MSRISVVIPAYNAENYIGNCLQCFLRQKYLDFEIIIIDDGSADKTLEICEQFCSNDARFSVFSQKNGGVSVARNAGIAKAAGEYIVFADSDDTVSEEYLNILYGIITQSDDIDLGICGFNVNGHNAVLGGSQKYNGSLSKCDAAKGLFNRKSYRGYLFNKIFKADIIRKNRIHFDESAHLCEDSLFCSQYVMYIRKAYFLNIPAYNYIQREDSATHAKFNLDRYSIVKTYLQIMECMNTIKDGELDEYLNANYLVHHIQLFFMLRDQKKFYPKEYEYVLLYLKENKQWIMNRKLPLKFKLRYIYIMIFYWK